LYAVNYAWKNPWLSRMRWWLLVPGGALAFALIFAAVPGWMFALGSLLGLVSSGVLLASILGGIGKSNSRTGIGQLSFGLGLGLLLFYLLITLYYVSLLLPVPISRAALAPAAGMGLMLCALVAARQPRRALAPSNWRLVRWSSLLMVLPVSVLIVEALSSPPSITGTGHAVRVMTYNIHGAYGLNGRQDVEAIARVIESADTDIVVLQEIERGWLLEGSTDLLPLLSRRLRMPYAIMGAVTDPISGNAILSLYPIVATGQGGLPSSGTLVGRGYLWAQIDVGAGQTLRVITTHLHHEPEGSDVRVAQADALLQAWGRHSQTVLAGDMNAVLGSPEIQMLLSAGFMDSWAAAGQGDRPAIDWIFFTPDLIARNVMKIESPASDHPAVVATIERKERP
jgi:endonuclease/exonuclease/phosphatase family metal-dependent hydrolase